MYLAPPKPTWVTLGRAGRQPAGRVRLLDRWSQLGELGAVCWQPIGLMGLIGPRMGVYVGNLQVLWGLLDPAWGCMLGAACWQPIGLMGLVGPSMGVYVGNLQVLWGLLVSAWGCMLATYRSFGACWSQLGAVCWQPTGLIGLVGPSLGLYVGNLRSCGACWTQLGAVCWQPTGLMGLVGPSLGLYVGNLQGAFWSQLGAVCWQPTGRTYKSYGLVGPSLESLGLHVGNLQVAWGLLDPACGCMLATYRSYGALLVPVWGAWHCMLATYRSCGACLTRLGAVCWQLTGVMGLVGPSLGLLLGLVGPSLGLHVGNLRSCGACGPSLGLYVGNLQVLWGLLVPAWGYWGLYVGNLRSCGASWTQLLGLYVGDLQVLWGLLVPAWGCMLATSGKRGACWNQLGGVCWQLTRLMWLVGPSFGPYIDNLHVLRGLLDPAWGCILATYRFYGACWTKLGAVCWQPIGLMGLVGPSNLQVFWACWSEFGELGAICGQPTGLKGLVGPSLGLYVGNLQVVWGLLVAAWGCLLATHGRVGFLGPSCWGCMLAICRSYGACWTQLGAVCWQPTGSVGIVGPSLGVYVGNLQVLCGLLVPALGRILATYMS